MRRFVKSRALTQGCFGLLTLSLWCCLFALLAGCVHHIGRQNAVPSSLDNYIFEDHVRKCRERADAFLNDETPSVRSSYVESCLERAGYSRADFKHLWFY